MPRKVAAACLATGPASVPFPLGARGCFWRVCVPFSNHTHIVAVPRFKLHRTSIPRAIGLDEHEE